MSLEITFIELDQLTPYAKNSRTHSEAQIEQIAESIQEFGFTNPVLLDENKMIIAGHGRLAAAQLMELETVPCVILEGLTEAQKKAYVIADNKLALNAGWDWKLLTMELEALEEMDFDVELTGFSEDELAELIGDEDTIDLNDGADSSVSGESLLRLTFGANRVELNQAEFDTLESRLKDYIENFGGSYGFIGALLDA